MKHSFQRTDRLSALIQKEIGDLLAREVKDPRLHSVTITHVRMAKDLRSARVFFTALEDSDGVKAVAEGLKQATGFVQRRLAARVRLRHAPQLTFEYDASVIEGMRMDKLLRHLEQELEPDGQEQCRQSTE